MNTIPLIFNERKIKRTIIARKEKPQNAELPVCAVLISESNQRRIPMLENLAKNTFTSIISAGFTSDDYNIEHTARLFPQVTFIIAQEKATRGELVNAAVEESEEDFVLVLRDTLKINAQVLSKGLFERIVGEKVFCAAPRLVNADGQAIPVNYKPIIETERHHKRFRIDTDSVKSEKTIYTFDNIALYSKSKFIALGGFDYTIFSPYWQTLDLCARAWLWGETTRVYNSFQLYYAADAPQEDATINAAYMRFFLKNIAPVSKNGNVYIPISKFFDFSHRSGFSFFEAKQHFNDGRQWVEKNALRFSRDIIELCSSWEDM
ncbi:MAG: hypothetical protein Pg6C_09430 [Treponemataceae bacterium]|nr:MAG: hypothetical protein Pg6C_09430 [Treponemataceae bacterium]